MGPTEIFREAVDRERQYQEKKWGNDQDDKASINQFTTYAVMTAAKGGGNAGNAGSDESRTLVQKSMVGATAVAVGAIEAIERKSPGIVALATGLDGDGARDIALNAMVEQVEDNLKDPAKSFGTASSVDDWVSETVRSAGEMPREIDSTQDQIAAVRELVTMGAASMAGGIRHETSHPGFTMKVMRQDADIDTTPKEPVLTDRPTRKAGLGVTA